MRRILALFLVLAAACVAVGLALSGSSSAAITVNGLRITQDQFNRELQVIASNPLYQCYLDAKTLVNTSGAQSAPAIQANGSWTSGAVVEWTDLRVTQLVAEHEVAVRGLHVELPATQSSVVLARSALGQQLAAQIDSDLGQAQQESSSGFSCSGASSAADPGLATLTSLPAWFLRGQLEGYGATKALASLTPQQSTSTPALQRWYATHSREFDTLCAAGLVVNDQQTADTVVSEITSGKLTIHEAAKSATLDVDASLRSSGGSLGCFTPTNVEYQGVSQILGARGIGSPTTIPENTGVFVVALTRRTHNSFSSVINEVVASVTAQNAQRTATLLTDLQNASRVDVAPQLGRWVRNSLGGTLENTPPPKGAVTNSSADSSS